jgi:energy-coupling factor transporter ATP-binding protein EcfA2
MRIDSITLREIGPFDDVRIDLPEGTDPNLADVYLLTGPNGCGKTTVLYAIAALLDNTPDLLQPRMRADSSRASVVASNQEHSQERSMTPKGGPDLRALEALVDGQPLGPLDRYTTAAFLHSLGSVKMSWAAFAYAGTRKVESGHVAAISELSISPLNNSLSFRHHASDTTNLAQWIANQDFKRLKAKEAQRDERAEQIARSVRMIEDTVAEIIDGTHSG